MPGGGCVPQRSQCKAAGVKASAGGHKPGNLRVACGFDLHRLHARTQTDASPRQRHFLESKCGSLCRAAVGCKRLGTVCGKPCLLCLQAEHTLKPTQIGVPRDDAHIVAGVLKHCAYLRAFVLGVLVVRLAGAHFDALNPATQLVDVPLQCCAVRLHANGHAVFGHRAVVGAKSADRCPQSGLAEKHTSAHCATTGLGAGVANGIRSLGRTGFGARQRNGHGDVARATVKRVRMQRKAVSAGLQQRSAGALCVAAGALQVQLARDPAFGIKLALLWDTVVDHIDDSAYRVAAVHQSPRTAQHLDTLHGDGVRRYGMVIAQTRCINAGTAVLQNADAVTVQPADDGAAGIRAKVAAAHTRCSVQGLAQGAMGAQ